jgi:hypothetical protein
LGTHKEHKTMTSYKKIIILTLLTILLLYAATYLLIVCFWGKWGIASIGAFGDSFAVLNTFLSSLATFGVIITIYIQLQEQRKNRINQYSDKVISIIQNKINELSSLTENLEFVMESEYHDKAMEFKGSHELLSLRIYLEATAQKAIKDQNLEIYYKVFAPNYLNISLIILKLNDISSSLDKLLKSDVLSDQDVKDEIKSIVKFSIPSEVIELTGSLSETIESFMSNKVASNSEWAFQHLPLFGANVGYLCKYFEIERKPQFNEVN